MQNYAVSITAANKVNQIQNNNNTHCTHTRLKPAILLAKMKIANLTASKPQTHVTRWNNIVTEHYK